MLEINFMDKKRVIFYRFRKVLWVFSFLIVLVVGFYVFHSGETRAPLESPPKSVQPNDRCRQIIPALSHCKSSDVFIRGLLLSPKKQVALVEITDHIIVPVKIGDVITKDLLYVRGIRSSGIETLDCETGTHDQELTLMWRK